MSEVDIKQETEWLREFQQARHQAGYALGAIAAQVTTLYEAGLNGVAATLKEPLRVAEESVAAMDNAINRMISEDFERSMQTTNETFVALLRTTRG